MDRRRFIQSVAALGGGLALPKTGARAADAPRFELVKTGELDTGVSKVLGIAIAPDDRLYAAGKEGVAVFSPKGKRIQTLASAEPPVCAAVADDGAVFVGSRARVESYDPDGRPAAAWGKKGKGPGEFESISTMAVSGHTVFVADGGSRRLHRFASDGDFIETFGAFLIPSAYFDCAVDRGGVLYVGHRGKHRVERYDPNGKLLGAWGRFGTSPDKFCGCCNPANIEVFQDGRIATYEKGIPRLKVSDATGKLLACLESKEFSPKSDWMDLALDSRERIALADSTGPLIRFYELKRL